MDKARYVGMRFNPAKCPFKQRQVKFFGLILTHDGVVPDPARIEALKNLPELKDEKASLGWSTISLDLTHTWQI